MIVLFRVGGHFMGDEVRLADRPDLAERREIEGFIAGGRGSRRWELSAITRSCTASAQASETTLEWTDDEPLEPLALTGCDNSGPLRVLLPARAAIRREMAWGSPVWVLL